MLPLVGRDKNVNGEKYKGSFKSCTNILFLRLSGGKSVTKIKEEGSKKFFSSKVYFFFYRKKINSN